MSFHRGEIEVQRRAGERDIAARTGGIIRDAIPPGALKFIDKQPLIIISSQDGEQNIWTSLIAGKPGFATAIDERTIDLHLPLVVSSRLDPFWKNIERERNIGLLFIELATRKRLRVNGTLTLARDSLRVSVAQAYPNCPKYIQRREIEVTDDPASVQHSQEQGATLPRNLQDRIMRADTFFVGSSDGKGNMDASHRGGNPGFIEVLDERTLKIPDYPGNSMFNTLGNFMVHPKAGLLFVDFKRGKTLQLTGETDIIWEEAGSDAATGGTKRFWKFFVHKWIQINSLEGVKWQFLDYSDFNP